MVVVVTVCHRIKASSSKQMKKFIKKKTKSSELGHSFLFALENFDNKGP